MKEKKKHRRVWIKSHDRIINGDKVTVEGHWRKVQYGQKKGHLTKFRKEMNKSVKKLKKYGW